MKYGIDIGHNCSPDIGASGIRFEDNLNKEVGTRVIDKLAALGNSVINCTPSTALSVTDSLWKRTNTANMSNVDIYVAIHFNAGGGRGSEVFAASQAGRDIAQKVLNEIVALGYVNRGVKDGSWLYVIRNSKATAILIECAFVDSQEDMNRFNAEDMANAIVKGLTGASFSGSAAPVSNQEQKSSPQQVSNGNTLKLQQVLNRLGITDSDGNRLIEDGITGPKTTSAVQKLQGVLGLDADGIAGPITWNAINSILNKPLVGVYYQNNVPARYIQWRLGISVDGIFGNMSRNAVINYQRNNGLDADGIVGPVTWSRLIG